MRKLSSNWWWKAKLQFWGFLTWLKSWLRDPENVEFELTLNHHFEVGDVLMSQDGSKLLWLGNGRVRLLEPKPLTRKQRIRRWFYEDMGGWLGIFALILFLLVLLWPLIRFFRL